jgi:type IV pilus assembly protein PilE
MRGFTLVEVLVVLALVALLAGAALPAYRGQIHRAARADAVESLTRLQIAQERFRAAHGWYASRLALVGAGETSPQGHYRIALEPLGAEAYLARAEASGAQARDRECAVITLSVNQGFAQTGPDARCWNR